MESLALPAPLLLGAVVIYCLAAAFRYSVFVGMLERPLLVGIIWASFTGDWALTMQLALFFELFWLDLLYVGTYIPPFSALSLLICLLLLDSYGISEVQQMPLPLLLSIPWALTGAAVERWTRQRQSVLYFSYVERGDAARLAAVPTRVFTHAIAKLMLIQAIVFAGCYTLTENMGRVIIAWFGLPVFPWLNWGLLWTIGAAMGGFMALRTRRAYAVFMVVFAGALLYMVI